MATWILDNRRLTQTEQTINATNIYNIFSTWGWSLNAIAGMLGNMVSESTIGPGVVEGHATNNPPNRGYGLIQWTDSKATNVHNNPLWSWTYRNYGNYDWQDGDHQCVFINSDDRYNWISTKNYPLSYSQFQTSDESPEYLARAYFYNRERGTWDSGRETQARYWYDYFNGIPPEPPKPVEPPDPPIDPNPPTPENRYKKMPLYMYPGYNCRLY